MRAQLINPPAIIVETVAGHLYVENQDIEGATLGGADSIFAQAVLDAGGKLEVILPSANYRAQKVKPDHAARFDDLIKQATTVRALPFDEANRVAYEAANETMLSTCDRLFAVWDGRVGVDKGSTASVVGAARSRGVPVDVIWPEGAARD